MNANEMKNEFLIHYNAIATNSAPSLDNYEISVYLTKAQLELVKGHYTPEGNKYQKGFEATEKRRVDLRELIKQEIFTGIGGNFSKRIDDNSQFVSLNDDIFLILQEAAVITSEDPCLNNRKIPIKPITHDEYNIQKDNPFKKPSKDVIWRLDYSRLDEAKVVELISPYTISAYHVRYLQYPTPIIIDNLQTEFPGQELSIDGEIIQSHCKLDIQFHREIVDRAVELALRDYKGQNLESKVQLDQRNE